MGDYEDIIAKLEASKEERALKKAAALKEVAELMKEKADSLTDEQKDEIKQKLEDCKK